MGMTGISQAHAPSPSHFALEVFCSDEFAIHAASKDKLRVKIAPDPRPAILSYFVISLL